MTILIADDSFNLRKRLIKVIGGMHPEIEIMEAATGTEALNIYRSADPEIVILDISLPDISGIDILKEIKKLKPETRIIILTNYPSPEFRERCIKLGADYFFDKCLDYRNMLELFKWNFPDRQ